MLSVFKNHPPENWFNDNLEELAELALSGDKKAIVAWVKKKWLDFKKKYGWWMKKRYKKDKRLDEDYYHEKFDDRLYNHVRYKRYRAKKAALRARSSSESSSEEVNVLNSEKSSASVEVIELDKLYEGERKVWIDKLLRVYLRFKISDHTAAWINAQWETFKILFEEWLSKREGQIPSLEESFKSFFRNAENTQSTTQSMEKKVTAPEHSIAFKNGTAKRPLEVVSADLVNTKRLRSLNSKSTVEVVSQTSNVSQRLRSSSAVKSTNTTGLVSETTDVKEVPFSQRVLKAVAKTVNSVACYEDAVVEVFCGFRDRYGDVNIENVSAQSSGVFLTFHAHLGHEELEESFVSKFTEYVDKALDLADSAADDEKEESDGEENGGTDNEEGV